ncbi:hypothetical protein [Rathayibacter sp. AY1F9]|uniref:hypothetical protein n=1 Tax=Rathayibacter sp. AY1F9 TaxID=2080563 RepID=UPI000CE7C91B|nr:hypothetical protein [Rathayibacter sp. AY1F9]PPH30335.1 hypothetical protein C5C37_05310 [Rathayibacter sp. AY1F9]
MRALVPVSDPWSVDGSGRTDDGPVDDLSVRAERDGGSYSVRTLRLTGVRLGPRGSVHGVVTDPVATAALAIGSLLLSAIPAGLPGDRTRAAMVAAEARAQQLAADRPAWDVSALPLDGIDYALFTRTLPEGAVAHADLGWAVVALWSTGPLPRGPFHLLDIPDEPVPR